MKSPPSPAKTAARRSWPRPATATRRPTPAWQAPATTRKSAKDPAVHVPRCDNRGHVDTPLDSLFGDSADDHPAHLAAVLAPPATAGHYDELRGVVSHPAPPRGRDPAIAPVW